MASLKSHRKFGLDLVRMVAILPVMVTHYGSLAFKHPPNIMYAAGDFGVDIFFALSGFLIGGIILRDFENGFSWRTTVNFYIRRWMRTLPLYWIFFVASAFITIYGLTLDKAWTAECWAYLLFLQNLAWPMLVPWYHESWSLAIEEWFYLIFPLTFGASTIFGNLTARPRVVLVALVMAIAPLAARMFVYDPTRDLDAQVGHLVLLRLDSIAFGILAVCAVSAFPRATTRWRYALAIAGSLGVIFSIEVRLGNLPVGYFYLHTLLFTGIAASFAAIVIWANCQDWTRVDGKFGAGIVRWFSSRSYALYLCHGSVVKTMLHHGLFALPTGESLLIFASFTAVIAEIAHRLIELPIMRRRPSEMTSRSAPYLDPSVRAQTIEAVE